MSNKIKFIIINEIPMILQYLGRKAIEVFSTLLLIVSFLCTIINSIKDIIAIIDMIYDFANFLIRKIIINSALAQANTSYGIQ